jgi:hypothetical protein
MPSFFMLNLVRMPPQHMENFRRLLEIMQCQEQKPFAGRTLVEDKQRSGRPSTTPTGDSTAPVR